MKERPILFSAPMVRAILAGNKTQTRRVAKPQPERSGDGVLMWGASRRGMRFGVQGMDVPPGVFARCPYGQPGDRLWVREAYRFTDVFDGDSPARVGERCVDAGYRRPWAPLQFEADGQRTNWQHTGTLPNDGPPRPGKLRPGMFMPRWASRITLEVTGVRVERLQEISEADAIAEGVILWEGHGWYDKAPTAGGQWHVCARDAYQTLWESINGPGSWATNPWVWVVEFRRGF